MEEGIEKVEHNCGIVVGHSLPEVYAAMLNMAHRGREGAGIGFIGEKLDVLKWVGAPSAFSLKNITKMFNVSEYHTFIGHVRYATRGRKDKILEDAHPHTTGGQVYANEDHIIIHDCEVMGVHNGQVGQEYLRSIDPTVLKTGCDTEALLHFYLENNEIGILKKIPASYTMAIASKRRKETIVIRDRLGMKPGVLGLVNGKCMIASEDIVIRKHQGSVLEELEPGSVYYISPEGKYEKKKIVTSSQAHCFFEWNYIGDRDSVIDGLSVRKLREKLGEAMAEEFVPKDADLVTFLPTCPEIAARRYAEKTQIPFYDVMYKKEDKRSFMDSCAELRKKSIGNNLYVMPRIAGIDSKTFLHDKTIILIDDSTVRGNNSKKAINLLKSYGVKKIYLLNYTPQIGIKGEDNINRGCLYGVDMPPEQPIGSDPDEGFIARDKNLQQISEIIGAEIHYLSKEKMIQAFESFGIKIHNLCTFCIGGKAPY